MIWSWSGKKLEFWIWRDNIFLRSENERFENKEFFCVPRHAKVVTEGHRYGYLKPITDAVQEESNLEEIPVNFRHASGTREEIETLCDQDFEVVNNIEPIFENVPKKDNSNLSNEDVPNYLG